MQLFACAMESETHFSNKVRKTQNEQNMVCSQFHIFLEFKFHLYPYRGIAHRPVWSSNPGFPVWSGLE